MLSRIGHIIWKDVKVELRQAYAISGILLFGAVMVFIVFKSFNEFSKQEWSLLLWIIVLFGGLNAIVKSFLQEDSGTYIYYYTVLDPLELIVAKMIYNFFLMIILFSLITLLMILFGGNPISDYTLFFTGAFLGLLGISTVFTMVSSIASAGSNASMLMSILALPLVLPILLSLIKITAVAFRLIQDTTVDKDVMLLLGIDGILIGAGIILFPLVWKS